MKLYAQMYSIKEACQKDFVKSLEAIADMGYAGVEFAGYYDVEIDELVSVMDTLGLETLSAHIGFDLLRENLEEEIYKLKKLGAKYIVCPWSEMHTEDDAINFAKELTEIGKVCKDNGLQLLYHNHDHEFKSVNDKLLIDLFYANVDTTYLQQEVDVYWVEYAGFDAVDYLKVNGDRNPIVHLKQISKVDQSNVRAEDGRIDFKKLVEILPNAHFVYEQEHTKGDMLEDMALSLKFMIN